MMATTAMDRKLGRMIIVCRVLASLRMYSSLKSMARMTDREVFTRMNATLYRMVLRVIRQASAVWNRNSKFLKPIHSLPKKPPWMEYFWKARTTPNMGA